MENYAKQEEKVLGIDNSLSTRLSSTVFPSRCICRPGTFVARHVGELDKDLRGMHGPGHHPWPLSHDVSTRDQESLEYKIVPLSGYFYLIILYIPTFLLLGSILKTRNFILTKQILDKFWKPRFVFLREPAFSTRTKVSFVLLTLLVRLQPRRPLRSRPVLTTLRPRRHTSCRCGPLRSHGTSR